MKKILILMLVVSLTLSCVSFSAGAVSSDSAVAYYEVLKGLQNREIYGANSHLADFDGDGNEELLILYGDYNYYELHYEVYSGENLVAQESFVNGFTAPYLYQKGERLYLAQLPRYGDANGFTTYTLENGTWRWDADFRVNFKGGIQKVCTINGTEVSESEYNQRAGEYREYKNLDGTFSALNTLLDTIDLSVSGYENVYTALSSGEKKTLFDDFLYDIAFSRDSFDSRTATDEEIADLFVDLYMDTDFPQNDWPYTTREFTALTQRYLGRTIDYEKFAVDNEPTAEDWCYNSVYYDDIFYPCLPQRGSDVGFEPDMGKDPHLYALGGSYYYAAFKLQGTYSDIWYDGAFGAIVKKNKDNTYQLVRLGSPMSKAELDALINPSDWAEDELAKAEEAELIPSLDGEPLWKDTATRLQFAQLAVNLAEKVTGKTLAAAPASTFADCSDDAVLKAYKAGIINGTSVTEFSPDAPLTREQLATMIWRTVTYIQDATKKEKLNAGGTLSEYADAADVSDYAKEAVAALAKNGIMKGTSETELSPQGSCAVEQSVILVYRTYMKIK